MRFRVSACVLGVAMAASALASADETSHAGIARGRYLAYAGDCAACHTAEHGKPYAGGRAIPTPFGTIYSTNITPDERTGIGAWTDDEFYKALHNGIAPGGRHLYPAFPYPWYTKLSRDDADALRSYLKTIEPVDEANRKPKLPWPLSWRGGMRVWNALFFDEGTYRPDPKQSAEWNRGAYLVLGAGHCGACHTPKNFLGAVKLSRRFMGGFGERWFAPSLRGDTPDGLGPWSANDIVEYLKTGATMHTATPAGPMGEVVQHSTQHLSDADLRSIAVYLKSLAPAHGTYTRRDRPRFAQGEALYIDQCAGCHLMNGEGVAHVFPSLKGNSAVQAREPANVIRTILEGGRKAATNAKPTALGMPAFDGKLDDAQVAELATYVRNAWGNTGSTVSAEQVKHARRELDRERHAMR